jgi:uncharacterized protein with ATP-grasp and redox domains
MNLQKSSFTHVKPTVEDFIKHKDPFIKKKSHDNEHLLDFTRKMENNMCFEKQNTYFRKHSIF